LCNCKQGYEFGGVASKGMVHIKIILEISFNITLRYLSHPWLKMQNRKDAAY